MQAEMDGPVHRACASCRAQKVRCAPDGTDPLRCHRCARVGRECVFMPVVKRRLRKRTDTRVAELEREMRTMRALLKHKVNEQHSGEPSESQSLTPSDANVEAARSILRRRENARRVPVAAPAREDIIGRGLLSIEQAHEFLETYRTLQVAQFSLVPIPEGYTVDQMRADQPTLFLAVMAAASTAVEPRISKQLDAEVAKTYAERCLIRCESSLELIQALLISAAWYAPPDRYAQLTYYKYINMAATMCMELGIGTRPPNRPRKHNDHSPRDGWNTDGTDHTTQAKRVLVATFCFSASAALTLRRPCFIQRTAYLRDCIAHLETASDGVPTDKITAALGRLNMIVLEISDVFSLDDSQHYADICEPRTQLSIKHYAMKLSQWHDSIDPASFMPLLKIMYHTARLILHEVVIRTEYSSEDFKAPFLLGRLEPQPRRELPTAVVMDCVQECITSAHAIMDAYLDIGIVNARAMPWVMAIRQSFAALIIAKLSQSSTCTKSRIASMIDRTALQAVPYMDKMILHARDVIGSKGHRVPGILMTLLFKVRQWCMIPELTVDAWSADHIDLEDSRLLQLQEDGDALESTVSSGHTSSTGDSGPSTTNWEHMDLENDFYSFLDVNNYDDGLDWAAFTNDVGNIIGSTNWPVV